MYAFLPYKRPASNLSPKESIPHNGQPAGKDYVQSLGAADVYALQRVYTQIALDFVFFGAYPTCAGVPHRKLLESTVLTYYLTGIQTAFSIAAASVLALVQTLALRLNIVVLTAVVSLDVEQAART